MYTFIVVKQKYASLGCTYGSWLKPTLENRNAKHKVWLKQRFPHSEKALQMFLSYHAGTCMYKKKENTRHMGSLYLQQLNTGSNPYNGS